MALADPRGRTTALPEPLAASLAEWLRATVGLRAAPSDRRELERRLRVAQDDFGFDDLEEFVRWLVAQDPSRAQVEKLAARLTIGETYFFRENQALQALRTALLPPLLEARRASERRLRLWSAGCSTGEEAYSLAMLLDQAVPDAASWNISILATDINPVALRKAEEGVYTEWSFRGTPGWIRQRYFEKVDGRAYRVVPELRRAVTFSYLNLSDETYPSLQTGTNAMDFIFCRNVLMYFAPAQIAAVAERFHRCLLDGGYLVVSPVETPFLTGLPFTAERHHGWTLHRKAGKGRRAPEAKARAVLRPAAAAGRAPQPAAARPRAVAVRPAVAALPRVPSSAEPEASVPKPAPQLHAATELYRAGRYAEAEEQLRTLLAAGGADHAPAALLARVLADQGRLQEAATWCREALAADKTDAGLHYLLATVLQEQQQPDEARASLNRALYLEHEFVLAHFALVNLALAAGRRDEARRHVANVRTSLRRYGAADVLPESDGMTAATLALVVDAVEVQEGL